MHSLLPHQHSCDHRNHCLPPRTAPHAALAACCPTHSAPCAAVRKIATPESQPPAPRPRKYNHTLQPAVAINAATCCRVQVPCDHYYEIIIMCVKLGGKSESVFMAP